MPADDYTAAVSGGLKLKNVSSSSKVSKSHRKKRPKSSQPESSANANESANAEKSVDVEKDDGGDVRDDQDDDTIDKSKQVLGDGAATSPLRAGKTEAELRHEERRRKRVCRSYTLPFPSYLHVRFLAKIAALAGRAPQARRHEDAQGACGRTEPLPQQSE